MIDSLRLSLNGRVALVTGAGRGIGLGMARGLAAAGCAVMLQDIEPIVADEQARKIVAGGGCAAAIGGDIGDLAALAGMVEQTVTQLGGLHILINNAAIQSRGYWAEEPMDEVMRQWQANLLAPMRLCQLAAPIFKKRQWGRFINIGSIQAKQCNPYMTAYSMGKLALENFTRTLARDMARDGVTANLIHPGWIDTWRNRDNQKWITDPKSYERAVPMGRVGKPEDFAGIAVLLCSDAGSYITGQAIYVDGGMSA